MRKDLEGNAIREWPREEIRQFLSEILKGEKTVAQIAGEKGISKEELIKNGFYGMSRYQNLGEQLKAWKK